MKLSSKETARIFGALSDVTRVEIVRLVAKAPRNVTQLTSLVGVSQPKVSRHLRILRDAGLVRDVRRGKWVWYELAEPSQGLPGSTAVAAVSSLFAAATSRRGEDSSAGTRMASRGFGAPAEVKGPVEAAGSTSVAAGKGGSGSGARGARRRRSVAGSVTQRGAAARGSRPPKTVTRRTSARRKKKDTPRRELEDFLL